MAKRKPIPYHASQAVDAAKMELTDAKQALKTLLSPTPIESIERVRLIGKTLYHVQEAAAWLEEVKTV